MILLTILRVAAEFAAVLALLGLVLFGLGLALSAILLRVWR